MPMITEAGTVAEEGLAQGQDRDDELIAQAINNSARFDRHGTSRGTRQVTKIGGLPGWRKVTARELQ